jgi:hypothetical protein
MVCADDFVHRATQVFPGARELGPGYCEVCGSRVGRYSDSLSVVLCDECWRPRFYRPRLPKARTRQ